MKRKSIIISGGVLAFLTGLAVTLAVIIPNNSIYNPANDLYILKNGCR